MKRSATAMLAGTLMAAACGSPGAPDAGAAAPALDSGAVLADAGRDAHDDAGTDAGAEPVNDAGFDAGTVTDAGLDAGTVTDAGLDAGTVTDAGTSVPGHPGWAKYTLSVGAHAATVTQNGAARLPLAGLVTVSARTYRFIFDASAMYVLTNPVQPDDQLDWNKLPGLSDCGQLDLSADGLMFGWRWRPDLTPPVLEVAQYANNGGTHLYPAAGLFTLDESELRAEVPLQYELTITTTEYRFHVTGTVGPRALDVSATFPRRCSSSTSSLKWAAGFYFGGTSTAPQPITGWAQE